MNNEQEKFWKGNFGNNYISRNKFRSQKEFDNFYIRRYGETKKNINLKFLKGINKNKPILEVGCNIGNQLKIFEDIGFKKLFGIDINIKSLKKAKKNINLNIVESSGFDIPFKDNYFNLVFTNNVLIHIHPKNLDKIFDEIYRVSNKYIFGFEYFNNKLIEIKYRNYKNKLWKGDYANILLKKYKNLRLVKEKIYENKDVKNIYDKIYLLKKI